MASLTKAKDSLIANSALPQNSVFEEIFSLFGGFFICQDLGPLILYIPFFFSFPSFVDFVLCCFYR